MDDNPLDVRLPTFVLEANLGKADRNARCFAELPLGKVMVEDSQYQPTPYYHESNGVTVAVLGTPVIGETIAVEEVATKLIDSYQDKEFLRSINCEFLFVVTDRTKNQITIINSRFSSPPFFYYHRGNAFAGSFSFYDLWKRLSQADQLEICQQGFYELLAYKRVFGHRTLDRNTQLMEPASALTFDGRELTSERYWLPDFHNKLSCGIAAAADRFGACVENSIKRKTSDDIRPALFLSGGMDTRSLLAAFAKIGKLPLCVTVNQFENREARVAKMLAESVGAEHRFLPFVEKHYSKTFDQAIEVTGGLQLPFCMFLGFRKQIEDASDVIFHGHGFDYMFQGMYLPRKHYEFLGRPLHYSKMIMPTEPLEDFFLRNVSYGIKNHNERFGQIIKESCVSELEEKTMTAVAEVGRLGREVASTPTDILEYFTFYNFARHYPFGDHWGMNTNLPHRTISFDNDVYALYQALPADYRFDARVFRAYLMKINPRMGRLMSANTTYPVCASGMEKTYYQLRDYILKKMGMKKRDSAREDFERMGIPTYYALVDELRNYTEEALASERYEALGFISVDGVRDYIRWFLENYKQVNGQLMMALITVDQILKRLNP